MRIFIFILLFCFFSTAHSADVDCVGEVETLSLQLNHKGTVTLSLSGGPSYVYLCNMDGEVENGVSFETCKAMYSTLMAAKITKKKMLIRFYDHESCSEVSSWAFPGRLGWTQVLRD